MVAKVTVDVIVCLPDNSTFIVIYLNRTTDVVTDDDVMFVINNLGGRDVAVTVVNPRDEILNRFRPVECDLTSKTSEDTLTRTEHCAWQVSIISFHRWSFLLVSYLYCH